MGWKVLRFWSTDIEEDSETLGLRVLARVEAAPMLK